MEAFPLSAGAGFLTAEGARCLLFLLGPEDTTWLLIFRSSVLSNCYCSEKFHTEKGRELREGNGAGPAGSNPQKPLPFQSSSTVQMSFAL